MVSLIANEARYYARQPLCWLGLVLATGFAFLMGANGLGAEQNSLKQLVLTQSALLMLVLPLFVGAMAPLAFLREHQSDMHEIVAAMPLTSQQWCLSRAAGLCLLVVLMLGLMQLASLCGVWSKQPELIFASHFLTLLRALVLSAVVQQIPAAILLSLLMLWCSQKSLKSTLMFVMTAAIFLIYPALAAATGSPLMANSKPLSPALWQVMKLLDPYAVSPLMQQWLQGQYQMQIDVALLLNRLCLIALCAVLMRASLVLAAQRVGRAVQPKLKRARGWWWTRSVSHGTQVQTNPNTAYFSVSTGKGRGVVFYRLVKLMLLQILRQRSSYFSLLLMLVLMSTEVLGGLNYVETYAVLIPRSHDALNRVMWDIAPVVSVLLLVLWSSRLSWMNRTQGMAELIAATPTSSALLVGAQWMTLSLLSLLCLLVSLAAPALAQILSGIPIDAMAYALQAAYSGLPLLVWSAALIACHALMRSQMQALLLIALLLALRFSPLPSMLGLEHPLWLWLQTPLQRPDLLWGFQASEAAFMPFMWFWILLSAFLLTLALVTYHRGTGFSRDAWSWRERIWPLSATLCLLVGTSLQGLNVHRTLQAQVGVLSAQERQSQRADYEKKYQHWQQQAQVTVLKVKTEIDFFSTQQSKEKADQNRMQISANMVLENQTKQAISQILVGQMNLPRAQLLAVSGATVLAHDARLGQTIFKFDPALEAGQQAQLQIKMSLPQSDLQSAQMHQTLRPEWSYVRMLSLLPMIGFVPELRLKNPEQRARWNLPALGEMRPSRLFADAQGRDNNMHGRYDWVQWESIVSAPRGMQVLGQGKLLAQWQRDQRQYFHYQTSQAIRNLGAFVVVPWQAQSWEQDGVSLMISSPEYNTATALSASAMQDTLRWFHQHLGRFPGDALRLVMMPELERGSSAYALPQLILLNHRYGLRALPAQDAPFQQIYRRTVHETAHQWFGHGIGNGVPEDGAFLVESLVKYVELVLVEQKYGKAGMQGLVALEQERFQFAQARSRALNQALIDADESHDLYSRATLVFARLRQELGDELICAALRAVWEQHRYPKSPATSMDFVRALLEKSPAQHHVLIRHLLLEADIAAFIT